MIIDLLKYHLLPNDYYTELSAAAKLLEGRRNDPLLIEKISNGLSIPDIFGNHLDKPSLVLFRQLATPIHETIRIFDAAKELNLPVTIFEYKQDKFVSARNKFKRNLGKLPIYNGLNAHGKDTYTYRNIVDFSRYEGLPLSEVMTTQGENLCELHHDLFEYILKEKTESVCVDISAWINEIGHSARQYYTTIFKVFIFHAILAEIYLDTGHERQLTREIVRPAFSQTYHAFLRKPLIWNYLPPHEQERPFWDCYPKRIAEYLSKRGYDV